MALYGSRTLSRAELRKAVETALGVELAEHESSYWGEYERTKVGADDLRVLDNFIDQHGELLEPDFPEHKSLVLADSGPLAVLDEVAELERLR